MISRDVYHIIYLSYHWRSLFKRIAIRRRKQRNIEKLSNRQTKVFEKEENRIKKKSTREDLGLEML